MWETICEMKMTLEISDTLYRQVKSKCSVDGRPVRLVTQQLYELWLAGCVSLDDFENVRFAERGEWAQEWVHEADVLADEISETSVDARLNRDLLNDDRR